MAEDKHDTAPAPAPTRAAKTAGEKHDELTQQAREAELKRQQDVVDAVAEANKTIGEGIGGPELNPGNPGHDFDTGKPV